MRVFILALALLAFVSAFDVSDLASIDIDLDSESEINDVDVVLDSEDMILEAAEKILKKREPHPGPPGGPLHVIYNKLNCIQKYKLDKIIRKSYEEEKREFNKKIKHFLKKLDSGLQSEVQQAWDIEKFRQEIIERKVKHLSKNARSLYKDLKVSYLPNSVIINSLLCDFKISIF